MKIKFLVTAIGLFFLSCSPPLHYYRQDGEEFTRVKKVAVMPFRNITSRREAGKIITNLFVHELVINGAYQVEEMGNIWEFFIRQRIRKKGEVDLITIKMLGSQLGVDAVIFGVVEEYYQEEGRRGEISPQVGLSIRMVEVTNGKILWKCRHQRSGDEYIIVLDLGKVSTVTQLAQKVIREMLATL